jgi:hypothetical protein
MKNDFNQRVIQAKNFCEMLKVLSSKFKVGSIYKLKVRKKKGRNEGLREVFKGELIEKNDRYIVIETEHYRECFSIFSLISELTISEV